MPGRSGVTVVTMLVCFVLFRTRDCGRIKRPAFPAPSVSLGERFLHHSGASRREIARARIVLGSLKIQSRSCATISPLHPPLEGSLEGPWRGRVACFRRCAASSEAGGVG